MGLEHFYGYPRPEKSGWKDIAIGAALHIVPWMHIPLRGAHIVKNLADMARQYGTAIPDVIRGKRNLTEVLHNPADLLNEYAAMSTPSYVIEDRMTHQPLLVSEIGDWANFSQRIALERLANYIPGCKDLPYLADYLNQAVDNPGLLNGRGKKQAEVLVALASFQQARNNVVIAVLHDATLSTAEEMYERMDELHVELFVRDLKRMAFGAGVGVTTGLALAFLAVPLAAPIGIVAAGVAERRMEDNREIPIIAPEGIQTPDGRVIPGFTKERYIYQELADYGVAVAELAAKTDALLKLITVPDNVYPQGVRPGMIRQRDVLSELSRTRTWEFVNALIATLPTYSREVHLLQAYSLMVYKLDQEAQAKQAAGNK